MNKENQTKTFLLLPTTVNFSLMEFIQEHQHKVSFIRLSNNSRRMRATKKVKKQTTKKTSTKTKTQQNPNQLTDRKMLQWTNVIVSLIFCICFLPTKQLGFSRSHMILLFSKMLRPEIPTLQRELREFNSRLFLHCLDSVIIS